MLMSVLLGGAQVGGDALLDAGPAAERTSSARSASRVSCDDDTS